MVSRILFILALGAPLALAEDNQTAPPGKPAWHGSAVNYGVPATVEVLVTGCQGWGVGGAHVVLVGEQPAEASGDGVYTFAEVPSRDEPYRLYVFGAAGTVSETTLVVGPTMAVVKCEVMLDMCVETELTVFRGKVTAKNGRAAAGATVGVPALFLETTADKKGRYELAPQPKRAKRIYWKEG